MIFDAEYRFLYIILDLIDVQNVRDDHKLVNYEFGLFGFDYQLIINL